MLSYDISISSSNVDSYGWYNRDMINGRVESNLHPFSIVAPRAFDPFSHESRAYLSNLFSVSIFILLSKFESKAFFIF